MKLNRFKAVIFNLNGVIVSTDEYHYQAWRQLADREGLHFDRIINERLKGVSRMQSLEILLSFNRDRTYTDEQKEEMAEFKNQRYLELIRDLRPSDVLPGVRTFCDYVKAKNIRIAVGSSSRNVKVILQNIGLLDYFDAVSDGTMIERSKPYPDVFVNAAKLLGGAVVGEEQYTLPTAGDRRIIRIEKVSATPKKYPRRSDKIKKQPLV